MICVLHFIVLHFATSLSQRQRPESCEAGRHEGGDTEGGHFHAGQYAVRLGTEGRGTRGAVHSVRERLRCHCWRPREHEPGTPPPPPHPLHFFPLSLSVPSHTTPQAPHCVQMRAGVKFGDTPLVDTMMKDGLVDAFHGYSMGTTAENVAKQYGITRADQDHFSALSQQHTEAAQKAGCFKAEIVPVTVPSRKGHLCCSV